MKDLAVVYSGSAQHQRTFNEPKYRKYIDDLVYLPDLAQTDLSEYRALILPTRMHTGLVEQAEPVVLDFLARGGTVVAFGDQHRDWLPGSHYEFRPTNFWWWLDPEPRSGLEVANERHSIFRHLSLDDATWHQHGVFYPERGADVAIRTEDGAAVLYTDDISGAPGRLVMTTLDPDYHFGAHFMPATERFLDRFFPWLDETLKTPAR